MLTRDLDSVVADLDAQTHRRFIKTHTPFDGLPHDPAVTYICVGRDPRDVFRSWDNHMEQHGRRRRVHARANGGRPRRHHGHARRRARPPRAETRDRPVLGLGRRPDAGDATAMNLRCTMHHLQTFWDVRDDCRTSCCCTTTISQTDLEGEMRRLAARTRHRRARATAGPTLVDGGDASSKMRERADVVAPDTTNAIWLDNRRFFNRGCTGQWRDLLDDADLARYDRRVAELAGPELVAWADHGARRLSAREPRLLGAR